MRLGNCKTCLGTGSGVCGAGQGAVETSSIHRAGFQARAEGVEFVDTTWWDWTAGLAPGEGRLHRKKQAKHLEDRKQALAEEEAFSGMRRWEGLSRGGPRNYQGRLLSVWAGLF